ncbi:MAG: DUF6159 family protein [Patulibacter minatonensis]
MGRIQTGWELTKESWSVVKADRSLVLFPVVAGVATVVTFAFWFAIGAAGWSAADSEWGALPALILGIYAVTVIGQFAAVALAACAQRSLHGADTTFGEGVAAARKVLPQILVWAFISAAVGALISALQSVLREGVGALLSSLIGGLANATWSIATFFVVPLIALEGTKPTDAIKQSSRLIRQQWGEGLVGSASIGLITFLLGFLPAMLIIFAGVATDVEAIMVLAVVVGVGLMIAASVIQVTLNTVFRVALYRFATTGEAPGAFQSAQLEHAFVEKRRGGLFGGR